MSSEIFLIPTLDNSFCNLLFIKNSQNIIIYVDQCLVFFVKIQVIYNRK